MPRQVHERWAQLHDTGAAVVLQQPAMLCQGQREARTLPRATSKRVAIADIDTGGVAGTGSGRSLATSAWNSR